ncbi:MAG: glycosyltransferase family 2 protein, partial [Planctomycetes bacterium]|nr:glycosyltransferase family 2 protein [Planctomycetota bacterium]
MGEEDEWLAGPGSQGLVSVITPAYNHGRFLGEMLESVMGQTYNPVEAVIVDDGSTDDTATVAQSLAKQYGEKRIRFFQGKHQGSQKTRNRALAQCRGEFIQLLDSDDLIHKDKFRLQVAV